MKEAIWTSSQFRYFLLHNEDKFFMDATSCENISFGLLKSMGYKCAHCESEFFEKIVNCSNCGSPNLVRETYYTPEAKLTFRGRLPVCKALLDLQDGDSVLIVHGICSHPLEHNSKDVKFIAEDCKIIKKYIPTLGAMSPHDVDIVDIYVDVECAFSMSL